MRLVCKKIAATLAVVMMCLMLPANVPAEIAAAGKRQAAPAFSLHDDKDSPIRLSDYKGKVVLVNFWATWCHGCKLEIPWFMEFQHKYKRKGLAIIGVSMDEDGWKSVKPFLKEKKLNYPVVIGNNGLADKYGLGSMPMSILIDRQGRIADSHDGMVDKDAWEAEIRTLLHEKR